MTSGYPKTRNQDKIVGWKRVRSVRSIFVGRLFLHRTNVTLFLICRNIISAENPAQGFRSVFSRLGIVAIGALVFVAVLLVNGSK